MQIATYDCTAMFWANYYYKFSQKYGEMDNYAD